MKLRDLIVIGTGLGLGACGGGGKGAAKPEPDVVEPAGPDHAAEYAGCGIYTTKDIAEEGLLEKSEDELTDEDYAKMDRDPAMQTPKDVDACLAYVRWALTELPEANEIIAASDISYGLCFGEIANGEACYWKALFHQLHAWTDEGTAEDAQEAATWLEQGCDHGYQPACEILQTGKDAEGRPWTAPEPAETEGGVPGGM